MHMKEQPALAILHVSPSFRKARCFAVVIDVTACTATMSVTSADVIVGLV